MRSRARSVAAVLQTRDTSDGLYQAVQLEDGSYALIRGGNPVQQRDVLPFEPRNGAEIYPYPKLADLENDWAACMDDIDNSDLMLRRTDASARSRSRALLLQLPHDGRPRP